jgi:hypothetical protein
VIADPARQGDKVVFLTGIPGAGKTSSIIIEGQLPPGCKAVYEGQLAHAESAIPKIQATLDAGLKPEIAVVHTPPEKALENTFQRFNDMGRGASIHTMADIQGNFPTGLTSIRKRFGDAVSLAIIDKTDSKNPTQRDGWEHISILQKEGSYEQIKQRLANSLEHARRAGQISDACYEQANGRVPRDISRDQNLAENSGGMSQEDE